MSLLCILIFVVSFQKIHYMPELSFNQELRDKGQLNLVSASIYE